MQQRRRGGHRIAVALLAAIVLSCLLVGAVVASSPGDAAASPIGTAATGSLDDADEQRTVAAGLAPADTVESPVLAQSVDADRTRIRIALQPDGDARWTVELWTRFEDDAGAGDGSSDAGNGMDGSDTDDRDASDETAEPADSGYRDS